MDRDQWIVWCGTTDEQDAITAQLGDECVSVYGRMTPEEKNELLQRWLRREVRVLVTKVSIHGFGMNLQQGHRQVFVGLGDSYESYYQAIRRSWRFGQTRPVDVHIVVSDLEAEIVANVRKKEASASAMTERLVRALHHQREEAA
jgi:superfamily II DNA helicase RecQ